MSRQMTRPVVVMIRHAQSEWNREGRFTGWADPALTAVGRAEAVLAGQVLERHGYRFDVAYTSRLVRARDTADLVLGHSGNATVPAIADWRLNERHYGTLQGEHRSSVARRVGGAQVWRWRRGFADLPPPLEPGDPRHPSRDPRWRDIDPERLPNGESLAATRERVLHFWRDAVAADLSAGRRVLVSSHGNTLRALIMALDGMSVGEVEGFEIPTGVPIMYAFSPKGEPIGWHYLDPREEARHAA